MPGKESALTIAVVPESTGDPAFDATLHTDDSDPSGPVLNQQRVLRPAPAAEDLAVDPDSDPDNGTAMPPEARPHQ